MGQDRWYNMYVKRFSIAYTEVASVKKLTLPKGAQIFSIDVFSDATSTSAELDVGTSADGDLYVDGLDVSVAGSSRGTLLDRTKLTGPTDIYAVVGGSPSSGGPFDVRIAYFMTRSRKIL